MCPRKRKNNRLEVHLKSYLKYQYTRKAGKETNMQKDVKRKELVS